MFDCVLDFMFFYVTCCVGVINDGWIMYKPASQLPNESVSIHLHHVTEFTVHCNVQHSSCRLFNHSDAHCCHMGTAIKHSVPDRFKLSFVIFDIRRHQGTLTLRAERQSARMSKITNDSLSRSGATGCFIAVPYGNSGRQRVNAR